MPRWFELPAKTGHTEVMAELGLCCELVWGVNAHDEQSTRRQILAGVAHEGL